MNWIPEADVTLDVGQDLPDFLMNEIHADGDSILMVALLRT